jgi:hypothetical protein
MNALLGVLLIWSLPFVGASCRSPSVQSTQQSETRPVSTGKDVVTLTTERPTGSFKLEPELLNHSPEVLEVSVTKVKNPAASSVDIFVYVASASETNKPDAEKVLVGTFSLYPADRPGKFMLGPAEAFRKFSDTRKSSDNVRLVFEMKLPAENKSPVEVTIESPSWGEKKV